MSIPHKTLILVRCKTHKLSNKGECLPPAVNDTKDLIFEINAKDSAMAELKVSEFLERVKECLTMLNSNDQ